MKKLAILLSLVMVLGVAASAMAAEVDFTGYVKYGFTKLGDTELFDSLMVTPDWQLTAKATVNDKLTATVRFDDKVAEYTKDLATNTPFNGVEVQRAFFTYDAGAYKVNAGKFFFGGAGEVGSLGAVYNGASVTVPFEGGSVGAAIYPDPLPESNSFGFTGDFAPVEGLTVYGDYVMNTLAETSTFTVEADYEVAGFTVYGEMGKDTAEENIMNLGATTTVGAFDLTVDYDVEAEVADFNVETKYEGITLGGNFVTGDPDSTIKGYAKVSF